MTFLDTAAVPPLPPTPDWDDLQPQPTQASGTPQESVPDWESLSSDAPTSAPDWDSLTPQSSSAIGTMAREVAKDAVPAVAGAASFGPGAAAGAELGTMAMPGVGTVIGGLAGGALTAAVGGGEARNAEDWLLDKLGLKQGTGELSDAQEAADAAQHPVAQDIAAAGTALIPFGIGSKVSALQRLGGAALMGGQEAGQEYVQQGNLDPTKIALSAAAGAIANQPRPWMERVTGKVTNVGRPDTQETATSAADKKTASQANDITTVAPGVAADNGPPPQNPVQTAENTGVRSGRDYRKDQSGVGGPTVPSEGINTDMLHPDLAAALAGINGNEQAVPEANSVGTPSAVPPAPAGGADAAQLPARSGVPASPDGSANPESVPPIQTGIAEAGAANEAAQNGKIKDAAALPSSIDPVEASRLQREQLANVQQRNAGTATAASQEQGKPSKVLLTAHKQLIDAGQQEAADKLMSMPRADAQAIAQEYLSRKMSKTGTAVGDKNRGGRLPKQYKQEGGVTISGGARGARRLAAVNAIKQAFTNFGGQELPTDRAGTVKLANDIVTAGRAANKGIDPAEAYKMTPKSENYKNYQWYKAARAVVTKDSPANIKVFQAAHSLKGDTGQNVDAEIAMKRRPTVDEAQATQQVNPEDDLRSSPRAELEKVPATKPGDTYVQQQHALVDWVNGLDHSDWERVNEQFPMGIEHEATEGNEPGETLKQAQEVLASSRAAGSRISGNTKATPVTAARADLAPTEPGAAAGPGKSLKGSPEWEALAKQYGGATAPDRMGRLEQEEAAARDPATLRENQSTVGAGGALQNSWDALVNKAKQLGASSLSQRASNSSTMDWLTGKYHDLFDPKATPPEREYGQALDNRLHVLGQKHTRDDVMLRANALAAPDAKASEWQEAYRAAEKKDYSTLPQKMQDAMKDHYDPLMAKFKDQYEEYRQERPDLNLPEWTEGYVPRMRKGTGMDLTAPDENDPILGMRRHLSGDAPQFKERQFYTLEDSTGKRTVFSPDEDGITTYNNGSSKHYDAPALSLKSNDPNMVGKTFNAGKLHATVDHARANEINTHVDPKNLQYIENPILTASNAYKAVKTARDNWKLVQSVTSDPEFQKFATKDYDVAKERGYIPIDLPDKAFKGMYAAPDVARVLNDYAQPGFQLPEAWRALNRSLTKMIFTTPIPHALNESQLWATQRGFDWLPRNGNYSRLVRTGLRAFQSVNSQDYIQDQLAHSGASPMLGGALTHGNMQQIAEKMGLEVQKDASKFDPIFRATGVTAKDVANFWYNNVAQKPMWWWSDFLLTQQFLEHQEKGASLQGAAQKSHEFISDYRIPTAALPNVLPDKVGRFIAQTLSDSSITMFGRYRYGLWRSAANMAGNLVGPNATKQQRVQAVGNILAMVALSTAVWPVINHGIRAVTGNKDAELNPAGMMRPIQAGIDAMGKGATKTPLDVFRGTVQPAPLITALTAGNNKDWKGDNILQPGSGAVREAGQGLEYAAHQIAPYNTAVNAAHASQGAGGTLGRILADQAGIKVPSQKAEAYKAAQVRHNTQGENARLKKPAGPIEEGFNKLSNKL